MNQVVYTLSDSDSDVDKVLNEDDVFLLGSQKPSSLYHEKISRSPSPLKLLNDEDDLLLNISQTPANSDTPRSRSSSLDRYLDDDFLLDVPKATTSCKKPKKASPSKMKVTKKSDEEKLKLQEEKLRQKVIKRKMFEEKQQQKAELKKKSYMFKQLKPGECIKFLTVFVDTNLLNQKFGGELLNALQKASIKYTVREEKISNTISWKRNFQCDSDIHDHVLVIWPWEELVELISSNALNTNINDLISKYPYYRCTIVVYEMEEYFKMMKKIQNKDWKANMNNEQPSQKKPNNNPSKASNLSRIDVETALCGLQLMLNVQYRFVEDSEEMGSLVVQYSKAVAELPYKLQRNKNQENTDWFAIEDSKEGIRVDSNCNGLSQLWQQQLCQFRIGLDVAQAIASVYRSPRILSQAYARCFSQQEKELLLQNIQIRRNQGPLNSARRVGPELSKKICYLFTATDGNFVFSQEH